MNISLSKFSTFNEIVSKNDYTQKFEEASKSMELLSYHQNWFSGKIGLSLSHSLKNLVIHLVKAKQEKLTEHNCAKMLKELCDEYNKKNGNNKNIDNALIIANKLLKSHPNAESVTKGDFSDVIAKFEKTNRFANSRYTKYFYIKDNNELPINITRENDNNHSSITINNLLRNDTISTWESDTLTTNSFEKKDINQSIINENTQITPEVVSQPFTNSIKVTPKNEINEDFKRLEQKYILLNSVISEIMRVGFLCRSLEKIINMDSIDQIIVLADNCQKLDSHKKIHTLINQFIGNQLDGIPTYETSRIYIDNKYKKIAIKLIDNLEKTKYLSTNLFFAENKSFYFEQAARTDFLKSLLWPTN